MRAVLLSLLAAVALTSSAQAERRMFIVPSNADGYGVDRCLSTGDKCGASAAAAYCKTHQFSDAASYSKVDKDEITGSIPSSMGTCRGSKCDEYVAIVCTR
jgi:hypothetical protein